MTNLIVVAAKNAVNAKVDQGATFSFSLSKDHGEHDSATTSFNSSK